MSPFIDLPSTKTRGQRVLAGLRIVSEVSFRYQCAAEPDHPAIMQSGHLADLPELQERLILKALKKCESPEYDLYMP